MPDLAPATPPGSLRAKTYDIIFGHEHGWGRSFDAVLILAILGSVTAVMLDSVTEYQVSYGPQLRALEWAFTVLFTLEYAVRIWCVREVRAYTLSFFGLVDLLAVLPTYLSVLLPGGQFLSVVRVLRVLRVFRVFKLARFVGEASVLTDALRNSRYKIAVFLVSVVCIVIVVGSLMYIVEGPTSGFTSIPKGVYWAVVTLTTVGYGDIAPATTVGQALASLVMIMGYGIIAVPTGIVTAELTSKATAAPRAPDSARYPKDPGGPGGPACPSCRHPSPDPDPTFCSRCGERVSLTGA
jgi:voltage-gated potassium channel